MKRNRPLSHRRDPEIIDLVPRFVSGSSAPGIRRFLVGSLALVLTLAAISCFLVILAKNSFTSRISETAGDIARISGFDPYLTDWATDALSILLTLAGFNLAVQLLLAYVVPGYGGRRRIRNIFLAGGVTLLIAVLPGTMMKIRKVAPDGLPAEMVEVDPAEERWFSYDGASLIFYADHLDGDRRFWNRPGNTPFDSAMAQPVTPEVRRSWETEKAAEQATEQARAALREEELRRIEQERQVRIDRESILRSVEERTPDNVALAEPASEPVEDSAPISLPDSVREFPERAPASTETQPTPGSSDAKPHVPVLVESKPVADHVVELLPGRFTRLDLDGRIAEIRVEDTTQLRRPDTEAIAVFGATHAHITDRVDFVEAKPVGSSSVVLRLRWMEPARPAGTTTSDVRPEVAASPVGPSPDYTRFARSFPLRQGSIFRVEVEKDTVDCRADGPVEVRTDDGRSYRLQPGETVRISNSNWIFALPHSPAARTFHLQRVAFHPDRFANPNLVTHRSDP